MRLGKTVEVLIFHVFTLIESIFLGDFLFIRMTESVYILMAFVGNEENLVCCYKKRVGVSPK